MEKILFALEYKEIGLKIAYYRKKKGYISNLILSFEDIVNVEDMITTNILCYNKLLNKMGDVVKEYKLSQVKDVIKLIDINNKSVLVMKK